MFRISLFEGSTGHSDVMHCSIWFDDVCLVNQRTHTTISIQGAHVFNSAIAFPLLLFLALVQYFVIVFYDVSCNVVSRGVTEFYCVDIEDFAEIQTSLVYFASLLEVLLNQIQKLFPDVHPYIEAKRRIKPCDLSGLPLFLFLPFLFREVFKILSVISFYISKKLPETSGAITAVF